VWILATVLGVLLFFVALLAIPVDVAFNLEKDEGFKPRVRVKWLFGLVGKDMGDRKKPPEEERLAEKKPKKEKPKKEKKKKRNIKPVLAVLRTRGLFRKLLLFIRGVFQTLSVRHLRLSLRVGLGNPADTGLLLALIGPTMVHAAPFSKVDIQLEPDFYEASIRGHCEADIRAVPLRLVGHFLLFAVSPTTIRAIMRMLAARRK
jgi:hypothetical protein